MNGQFCFQLHSKMLITKKCFILLLISFVFCFISSQNKKFINIEYFHSFKRKQFKKRRVHTNPLKKPTLLLYTNSKHILALCDHCSFSSKIVPKPSIKKCPEKKMLGFPNEKQEEKELKLSVIFIPHFLFFWSATTPHQHSNRTKKHKQNFNYTCKQYLNYYYSIVLFKRTD